MSSAQSQLSNKSEDKYRGRQNINYTQLPPPDNYHNPVVYPPQLGPITSQAQGIHYDPEQIESSPKLLRDSIKRSTWSRVTSDHDTVYEEYNTQHISSQASLLSTDGGTKVREHFVDREGWLHGFLA